jgi:HSP20 family protein
MARNPVTPFRSGSLLGGDPFLSLHREMNRLFDDVLRGTGLPTTGGQSGSAALLAPQLNVSETDNEIRITAELPGVSENDINVELNDDVLVIRGEKKVERKEEKERFHFVERSYGTFQRALQLPFPVDPEQVQARFENGVLTVTLPKTAQQERSRRIQVQAGDGSQSGGQQAGTDTQGSTAGGQMAQAGGSQGGEASQGGETWQGGAST